MSAPWHEHLLDDRQILATVTGGTLAELQLTAYRSAARYPGELGARFVRVVEALTKRADRASAQIDAVREAQARLQAATEAQVACQRAYDDACAMLLAALAAK